MDPNDIINEVIDSAGEWLEMTEDPATLVVGILANKIVKLNQHIEFLEKRVKYVSRDV